MSGSRLRMQFVVASAFSAVTIMGCATDLGAPASHHESTWEDVPQVAAGDTDFIPDPPPRPIASYHVAKSPASTSSVAERGSPGDGGAPRPEREAQVKVLGEVNRPGDVRYHEGADLSFYLAQAGGVERGSDLSKVQIIRGQPGKRISEEIAIRDRRELPALEGGDIVIVHAEKKSFDVQKSLSVAAATLLGTMALLIIAL